MKLVSLLDPGRIRLDAPCKNKEEALRLAADLFSETGAGKDAAAIFSGMMDREEVMSTGIGIGVAVPHVKIDCVDDFIIAIGRSVKGIDFNSLDGKPIHLIFMIGAATRQKDDFLKVLARVVHLIKNKGLQDKILPAQSPEEIYELLKNY